METTTSTITETVLPVLRFDWQDWLPYFEDEATSLDQKKVLIETLWSIVLAFVDLGWQVKAAPKSVEKPAT